MTKIKFEASRVSEVAEKASVDIRTVLKVAEGKPVKGKGKLDRILKALAALGLGLALLVVGCDPGDGIHETPKATCDTWGPVQTEGAFDGRQVCQDGVPVPPQTQLSGPCACPDTTPTGYYSCVSGIWYCLCVQATQP
jgi:hypothetical protein